MSITVKSNTQTATLTGTVVGGNGHRSDGGESTPQMLVNFSESNGVYSADRTYEEVVAAMASGIVVTARWQVSEGTAVWFMPTAYDSTCVIFQRDWLAEQSEYFRLQSDNTVTHSAVKYDTGGSVDVDAVAAAVKASLTTENWTFTLEDGSTVTKAVYVDV